MALLLELLFESINLKYYSWYYHPKFGVIQMYGPHQHHRLAVKYRFANPYDAERDDRFPRGYLKIDTKNKTSSLIHYGWTTKAPMTLDEIHNELRKQLKIPKTYEFKSKTSHTTSGPPTRED